jgi:hypothetical protein
VHAARQQDTVFHPNDVVAHGELLLLNIQLGGQGHKSNLKEHSLMLEMVSKLNWREGVDPEIQKVFPIQLQLAQGSMHFKYVFIKRSFFPFNVIFFRVYFR